MILVDTSAWVEFFRGKGPLVDRVDGLLVSNEVALCGPVITELRRGLGWTSERRRVIPLLAGCHKGSTVKTLHLLIAVHALVHAVPILAADRDFELIRRAGLPLVLVS